MEKSKVNVINHVDHGDEMLRFLYNCRKNELFCDVSIKIGETLFKTHRIVVAMVSDYLKVLMEMDGKDKEVLDLTNHGIPVPMFESILNFAYTGKIELDNRVMDITKLIEVVDFLGVKVLKNDCEDHLLQSLSQENVISNLILSEFYNLPSLFKKSKELFSLHFESFLENINVLDIPPAVLKRYLGDNELVVHGLNTAPLNKIDRENLILRLVLYYVNENLHRCPEERSGELFDVFNSVKLPLFEKSYFVKKLNEFGNLHRHKKMLELIEIADLYSINEITEKVPEFWKTSRKLQHKYEVVQNLANGGYVGYKNYRKFNDDESTLDPFMTMKTIKIWIRRWDGRKTIGALSVIYRNGKEDHYGENKTSRLVSYHTISLEDGEVITAVHSNSGYLVDSLQFVTNKNKTYGPFGGDGGGIGECNPSIENSYLHSFLGASVRTQSLDAIIELGFRWVTVF